MSRRALDIRVKRAYAPPARSDGYRVLVDGVWPRGVSRDRLRADAWERDLAPSKSLRQWFGHRPERWDAFRERYFRELDRGGSRLDDLRERARRGRVTLVYGARDTRHNNAVALREYLERR